MEKSNRGIIQIIIANILMGFLVVLIRWGENMGTAFLSFSRVFLAAVFIYILFLVSKNLKLTPFKKEKKKLIFFGLLHAIILFCYFASLIFLTIASASLLFSTLSIWTVVFSYFILKEKINQKTIIALTISIAGLVIILSPQSFFIFESLIGSVLGLLSGILAGLVYVLSKTFKSYDKISLTFWQNFIAVPFLIPLLFFKISDITLTSSNILILILIGLVGASSFIFMFKGFGNISGQKGGILTLSYIIFAILFGYIFLQEIPTLNEIIGGLLIIIGSYIVLK